MIYFPHITLETSPAETMIKAVDDAKQDSAEMIVCGRIAKIRSGKKITFLQVTYGKKSVQVVCETKDVADLTLDSTVQITGKRSELPPGKYTDSGEKFEIIDPFIKLLSKGDPVQLSKCPPGASAEVKIRERAAYIRDPEFALRLRLSSILETCFRKYFDGDSVTQLVPPMFTKTECEGGATVFSLKHPGKTSDEPMTVYLPQSSQFPLEIALRSIGDCYCIEQSFRAEKSHTRRHLTEFRHVEAEWGFVLTMKDHIAKLKSMLEGVLALFIDDGKEELLKLEQHAHVSEQLQKVREAIVMTHREAIEKCRELGIMGPDGRPFGDRDDIPEAQERALIDKLDRVVFLIKFPAEFKSFYMALDSEDPSYVLGCDVEVPGVGEIIGSGIREADYDRLLKRIADAKLDPEDYRDYIDLRKSGYHQTSGMGLGLGRMLCWLLRVPSIRDVVAFPSFPGSVCF